MTAPKRRWVLWSLAAITVPASFVGGWIAGRVSLRHEQAETWLKEAKEDPFANTTVETHKPLAKDLSKDYLKFPLELDYQGETRPPSTESTGFGEKR